METMMLLSGMMPEDVLIRVLKSSIKEWEAGKSEKSFCKIATICLMVATKEQMKMEGGGIAGIEKVVRDFEESKRLGEIMNPPKN